MSGTDLAVAAIFVFVALTFFVAPWVGERRRGRTALDRLGRINTTPKPVAPHFTRDPSPRPRSRV